MDSWNLLESFTTESVSPYSFYEVDLVRKLLIQLPIGRMSLEKNIHNYQYSYSYTLYEDYS